MNRREALKNTTLIAGYTFLVGAGLSTVSSCKVDSTPTWVPDFLTQEQVDLVAEIAERIIPKTDTPGAKEAMVHRFIDANVRDNFTIEQQGMFAEALKIFDVKAQESHQKNFVSITDDEKDGILKALHQESIAYAESNPGEPHVFPVMKDMTSFGYFTSEVGATQFLKFDPIPGEFIGCVPLSEVGGTWAL